MAATFNSSFLSGGGHFWSNPRGHWLVGAEDPNDNLDMLATLIAYLAFLRTGWHLPLFYIPDLGFPTGSSVIFTDAIPLVALVGKMASGLAGTMINPYGVWVGLCFILSAVFACLLVIEAGQRSLLAAIAAALLAVSAPPLLHRFGHLPLMAHFLVIGALWLYLRDLRVGPTPGRMAIWTAWLCLALLINPYLFAMTAAVYAAAWLRRFEGERPSLRAAAGEPLLGECFARDCHAGGRALRAGCRVSLRYSSGFGYYSIESGLAVLAAAKRHFPGADAIVDTTGGQYEGFNYFGIGGLLIVGAAMVLSRRQLAAMVWRHRFLCLVLVAATVFALSYRVFLFDTKLVDLLDLLRIAARSRTAADGPGGDAPPLSRSTHPSRQC